MTSKRLKLSVLDQSPVRSGGTPAEAVAETLELARLADRLGYHRYWLAEHHSAAGLAGSAPEILIPRVAADTERIRVGSGGVMLPHYSAYKVAESFRVLEALYPGRVDLGIGRAPGSDRRTMIALNVKSAAGGGPGQMEAENFPQQVADLAAFLHDAFDEEHPFKGIHATPGGESAPDLWLLGSSDQSAQVAAHFGTAFSFAHFIAGNGAPVMRAYRRGFKPSAWLEKPLSNVGIFVICAETEEKAERLALSRDVWRSWVMQGDIRPFPSEEEAEAALAGMDKVARSNIEMNRRLQVIGTPETVKRQLEAMAADYEVDELVVVTITHSYEDRARSYELLARAFELEAAA